MLNGTLLAESLLVGHDLRVPGLTVTRISRHDVTRSTAPSERGDGEQAAGPGGASSTQPGVWTFIDFEAPDDSAESIANALAAALITTDGWYADFRAGDDHVVVFAGRVFRYRVGDAVGRQEAVDYGLAAGTPPHQLDWGE